jgi:hypothetical protein
LAPSRLYLSAYFKKSINSTISCSIQFKNRC